MSSHIFALVVGVLIMFTLSDAGLVEPMHVDEYVQDTELMQANDSDDLPPYLQKMKDSVKRSEHKEDEARKKYNVAKGAQDTSMLETKTNAHVAMGAQAEYMESMAHMKKLADEFGRKAKEYEARSRKAGGEYVKAAQQERAQVAAASATFPWLALQASKSDITADAKASTKGGEDALTRAMKPPEVPRLVKVEQAKHAKYKGPMGAMQQMQDEINKEQSVEAGNTMKWNALADGWTGKIPNPDEGDVRAKAIALEATSEKQLGHKLAGWQKKEILEATRVHEKAIARINMAQRRVAAMNKLVQEDRMAAKKDRAAQEVEQMLDTNDAMQSRVKAAKIEAKMALGAQQLENNGGIPESLMKSVQDIREKAAKYEAAEEAEAALVNEA